MSSLWWPGDQRAGALMADPTLLGAMLSVEQAWLTALTATGAAPAEADTDLAGVAASISGDDIARAAESGGNPVIPLVQRLRELLPEPTSNWLHRGLTSQDVLDTAIMLCVRDAVDAVRRSLRAQSDVLCELVSAHRDTRMVARTLTQTAVPTTFGVKAAGWLHGVIDADEALAACDFPVQCGGAGGTLAAAVEVAGVDGARQLQRAFATALALTPSPPWHTRRAPITRVADAAVTVTDALGRVANDVLVLGRPEVGELRHDSVGSSSTMPHKANPTLAVLIRRAALAGPALGSTLHLAAAEQVDERADGGWHVEWQSLATLLRRTVVAADQGAAMLRGLRIDTARMAAHLAAHAHDAHAEQRAIAEVTGRAPEPAYFGLAEDLVDDALARAHAPIPAVKTTEVPPT